MEQVVCDVCRQVIPGGKDGWRTRKFDDVTFQISLPKDICYYCACEKVVEAALKWKAESDQSVEGQRRLEEKGKK